MFRTLQIYYSSRLRSLRVCCRRQTADSRRCGYSSATVHLISMKFDVLMRILISKMVSWPKTQNFINPTTWTRRHLENRFQSSQRHVVRLTRKSEEWSESQGDAGHVNKISNFENSRWCTATYRFEYGYIAISPPLFIRFRRNLVYWCEFWFRRWARERKLPTYFYVPPYSCRCCCCCFDRAVIFCLFIDVETQFVKTLRQPSTYRFLR